MDLIGSQVGMSCWADYEFLLELLQRVPLKQGLQGPLKDTCIPHQHLCAQSLLTHNLDMVFWKHGPSQGYTFFVTGNLQLFKSLECTHIATGMLYNRGSQTGIPDLSGGCEVIMLGSWIHAFQLASKSAGKRDINKHTNITLNIKMCFIRGSHTQRGRQYKKVWEALLYSKMNITKTFKNKNKNSNYSI